MVLLKGNSKFQKSKSGCENSVSRSGNAMSGSLNVSKSRYPEECAKDVVMLEFVSRVSGSKIDGVPMSIHPKSCVRQRGCPAVMQFST